MKFGIARLTNVSVNQLILGVIFKPSGYRFAQALSFSCLGRGKHLHSIESYHSLLLQQWLAVESSPVHQPNHVTLL